MTRTTMQAFSQKWWKIAIAAAVAAMLTPGPLAAAIRLRPGEAGHLLLEQNGKTVTSEPIRFVVQEWQSSSQQTSASPSSGGRARVGSVVEMTEIESRLMARGNGWESAAEVRTSREQDRFVQRWVFPNNIEISATWEQVNDALRVRGEIVNTAPSAGRTEIPVTLMLSIPVRDSQLEWLQDLHRTDKIVAAEEKLTAVPTTAGSRAAMSRYPFGAVRGENIAIATGLPLNEPRIQRVRWDGARGCLIAEIDVALSALPTKMPHRAPFSFLIFDFPKEFGFRGACQVYYRLNPRSYEKRLPEQGQWMPFTQIDKIHRAQDFSFKFHEYHPDVSVAWDWNHGVYPLVYCEPPIQYVNLDETFKREVPAVEAYLATLDTKQGSQIRSSGIFTPDGHFRMTFVDTPWAKGARIPTNGDPEIPRTANNPVNSFDVNWAAYEDLYRARATDAPADWMGQGQIVDGVIGGSGRTLHLAAGQAVRQVLESSGGGQSPSVNIRFLAKTRTSGKVSLRVSDGTSRSISLTPTMREYEVTLEPSHGILELAAFDDDVWVDDVRVDGAHLNNGDFERGERDSEAVAGLYMDSFEGWDSHELNFREEHLRLSDFPLTFDTRSGRTAQVIMFHNYEFAAEALRRLRARDHILMGNTALYQWPWSAHYLDVLGIETPWGQWATQERLDYLRALSYHKPYCFLLNVRFEGFRGAKVADYFARCFFYGFWPGFFSHDAANAPYWESQYYEEDRPFFVKYMRPQQRVTAAGWEPVTLASAEEPDILVERWGGGPYDGKPLGPDVFYLTVYNPTNTTRTVALRVDASLKANRDYLALELLQGKTVAMSLDQPPSFALGAGESAGLYFVARDQKALQRAWADATRELGVLVKKYADYGLVDAEVTKRVRAASESIDDAAALASAAQEILPNLEPLYLFEFQRALREWRVLGGAYEEAAVGKLFSPSLPAAAVPNEKLTIRVNRGYEHERLVIVHDAAGSEETVPFVNGEAAFVVPQSLSIGKVVNLVIRNTDTQRRAPFYETSLPVLPAVVIGGAPNHLALLGKYLLRLEATNNLSENINGELVVQTPDALSKIAPMKVQLAPCRPMRVELPLEVAKPPAVQDERGMIRVELRSHRAKATLEVPVTILAQNASLLRASQVSVAVDSCFLGYSAQPLTDGVVDTRNVEWQNAAWASDEGDVPHWAEFTFAEPTTIREVVLYWALDDGKYWTSRKVSVEIADGEDGGWKTIATIQNQQPTPRSEVKINPVTTKKLRIYQEPGDGPPARRGILWLAEVEAR